MDITPDLLDRAYAWTATRIAAVPADGLDAPTPCSRWNLQELLDHTIESMGMFTDAIADAAGTGTGTGAGPNVRPLGPTAWDRAIAELAVRNRRAWQAPGIMDRTLELPIGTMPASMVVSASALEVVVHGWDISQASGEAAEIPDHLARPILAFARHAVDDATRGDHFAADVGIGDTPAEALVAYLGRKPR